MPQLTKALALSKIGYSKHSQIFTPMRHLGLSRVWKNGCGFFFAQTNFALFHAADTRVRAELETILGLNYSGVLSSDDYSVYNGYDVKAQQKCLAHLRRHLKKLIKLPGLNNQKIGEKFVKLIDEAFKNYSLFQENQNISELFAWADEFKLKVKSSIDKWIALAGGEASKLLRSLQGKTALRVVFFRPFRGTSR